MFNAAEWAIQVHLALQLLGALAAGLLVGIERGWRQRAEAEGTRVAGVRTFTLIGGTGGLVSITATHISPWLGAILLAALVVVVAGAFLRTRPQGSNRDATTIVAAMATLGLGLLAGAGLAALALAGAALITLVLALRRPMHGVLRALSEEEVRAIARYAVIAAAVLPFLPDAAYGPYGAWNPFRLWLVVVLVTGFSVAGYIANRIIGQNRGTIATALIGGAYSSTAVTAALSTRLKAKEPGPFATGIALASAVMYVRVLVLAAILAPRVLWPLALLLGPAMLAAFVLVGILWKRETASTGAASTLKAKPFELLPALGFLLAVALSSMLVHWAEAEFGQSGAAISLFIAGSFDVDAAMVAYAVLPAEAVPVSVAALALAGTVVVNMAFKTAIVFANAGPAAGRRAGFALLASCAILAVTCLANAAILFG
ncbi:DUF4010 domain-containing protein [Altererythrobacter lauratis]|uniref:MgtC/SapB family protein n=1 Tax=Alteraurantiacibacter lauratis TaxID=2054627 RepID=A0ABV7EEV7_9SPHN